MAGRRASFKNESQVFSFTKATYAIILGLMDKCPESELMIIVGLFVQLVRLLVLVILRGAIGGGILLGVSSIFKIGKSDFSECFAASAFAHAVEIILLIVLSGFAYIYMIFDPGFHGIDGIGTLYSPPNSVGYTIFRAAILTVLYTYFTAKFLSASLSDAFISSLVSVIIYFLLASLIGYILLQNTPMYAFGMLPRLF